MVGQVARTQRGLSSKRGHQHHGPRFEGNRISRVDPTDIIAALRDVDRMPVTMLEQICYEPIGQAENLISAESRNANEKKTMIDAYKLAIFGTENIDPAIIRDKCSDFGRIMHCRQHNGICFPLFTKREHAQNALTALRRQGYVVEYATCRPYPVGSVAE